MIADQKEYKLHCAGQLQEKTKPAIAPEWTKCASDKFQDLFSILQANQMNRLNYQWTTGFNNSEELKKQNWKEQVMKYILKKQNSGNSNPWRPN